MAFNEEIGISNDLIEGRKVKVCGPTLTITMFHICRRMSQRNKESSN